MSLTDDLRQLSVNLDQDGDFEASQTILRAIEELDRLHEENCEFRMERFCREDENEHE